jgi:hypothetical protein
MSTAAKVIGLGLTPIKEIAGVRFEPQAHAAVMGCISKQTLKLLAEEGPRAFEMPRSAALAHEVGHAIVGAHDGFKTARVAIWSTKGLAGTGWVGKTYYASWSRGMRLDESPPDEVLKHICLMIAGAAGEQLIDREGCRSGSSQIVVSQALTDQLTRRDEYEHIDPPSCGTRVGSALDTSLHITKFRAALS